jgi:hypothetical protein
LRAAYFRRVLRHVAGLSPSPTTMPDKTPRRHAAVSRLPVRSLFDHSTRAHAVSGLFTRSCPNADDFMVSPRPGAFGASRVLRRLSSCMPRPDDSGGHPRTGQNACFMLASRSLTLSPSAGYVSRSCTSTSGSAISPTAYRILCVRLPCKFVRGAYASSAAGPTLDTGGWLALTRPGLSPGKRRRALLGATTFRLARRPLPRRSAATARQRAVGPRR